MGSNSREQGLQIQVQTAMRTDIGLVRECNEDAAYIDPAGWFLLVADGMGGHRGGAVASAMAIELMREGLEAARYHLQDFAAKPGSVARHTIASLLGRLVRRTNTRLCERARNEP